MNIKLQFKVERRLGDPTITVIIDDNMPSYTGVCPDQLELNVPVISGCHELRIQHYGKKTTDHVYDSSGKVIIDKHVEIKSIVLDEVELVEELWDGEFYPVYDQDYLKDCISANIKVPYSLRPNLYLGHNGTWILKFEYPCIDWLLAVRQNKIFKVTDPDFITSEEDLQRAKDFFNSAPDLPWDLDFIKR